MDTERLQEIKDAWKRGDLLSSTMGNELITALEEAQAELAEAKDRIKDEAIIGAAYRRDIATVRAQLAEAQVEKIALENALAHIDSAYKEQLAEARADVERLKESFYTDWQTGERMRYAEGDK